MRAFLGLAIFFALASAGCFHQQAYLPGVIDMRTDGSGLPAKKKVEPDPRMQRVGVEAFIQGAGVRVVNERVTIEDRRYWLFGSFPVYNDSTEPEIQAAVKSAGAMRDVEIGEEIGPIDALVALIAPQIVGFASWFLPAYTLVASGKAVQLAPPAPIVPPVVPSPQTAPPRPPPAENLDDFGSSL